MASVHKNTPKVLCLTFGVHFKSFKMAIVLIVYVFSWIVLLLVLVKSKKDHGECVTLGRNTSWSKYLIAFAIAPLWVILTPYTKIQNHIKKRKAKQEQIKRKIIEDRKAQYLKCCSEADRGTAILFTEEYDDVASRFLSMIDNGNFKSIFTVLNKLSLPSELQLKVSKLCRDGLGDRSIFYVDDHAEHERNIWEYIMIDDSPMGVWQAYLLHVAQYHLPMFWHSLYGKRSYIYSIQGSYQIHIRPSKESDFDKIQRTNFTPVIFHCNDKYHIATCYWSNWQGLVREHLEFSIVGNKVVDIAPVRTETLIRYNSGLRF